LWSALENVHLESLAAYSLVTFVIDLRNNFIYLHYFSQYDQFARMNLAEELARGEREIPVSQLFPQEVIDQAEAHYKFILARDILGVIALLAAFALALTNLALLIRAKRRARPDLLRRHAVLSGLCWACLFGLTTLLLLNLYPSGLILAGHTRHLYRIAIPLSLTGAAGFLGLFLSENPQ
jgi:hypothetical protein